MKNTNEVNEVEVSALIAASDFNLETLEIILKDLRNARRAVLAIETGRTETEAKVEQAKADLTAALEAVDLEGITKHTDELKRGLRKLAEKPEAKVAAFNSAVVRLAFFTENNTDLLDEAKPDLKAVA